MARAAERLNRRFDGVVALHMRVGHRLVGTWRFFSLAAFATATVTFLALGVRHDLPVAALVLMPVVPVVIFSAHRRRVLRAEGPPRLIFHRHLAASAAVLVPALWLLGALSWAVIDAAATASLAGLAVGRIGCLRSGCCYGRPASIGPRYPWLGDVRRLPVQVLDAAACVVLVVVMIALQESEAAAGTATAVGLGGYFAVRFLLDELRDERVRSGRLTEAQRIALAVAALGGVAVVSAWLAG